MPVIHESGDALVPAEQLGAGHSADFGAGRAGDERAVEHIDIDDKVHTVEEVRDRRATRDILNSKVADVGDREDRHPMPLGHL